MKRSGTTVELSICKRLAWARLKAGEWSREIQSVKGFSLCLTFRLSTDPEESPTKTTQELYDLIPLLYCRMYLQKHSWGQFSLSSCVQCCNTFIYIYICIVLLLVLTTTFNYFVILHCSSCFLRSSVGCTNLMVTLIFSPLLSLSAFIYSLSCYD